MYRTVQRTRLVVNDEGLWLGRGAVQGPAKLAGKEEERCREARVQDYNLLMMEAECRAHGWARR